MSEFVYFSCPGVRIWGFSSFSKTFQKIEKIEVYAHRGPGELFWFNSLTCPFSIQMSEFVYFSCPGVRIWGFSSFLKTFKKIEKIEVFARHRPGELFWLNSLMSPFSIQMSEFVYFSCPGVRIWRFSSFSKTFKKNPKKLKFSHTADMENFFGSIHSSAYFPSKWVKLYILVVLEWEYEDFLHFRKPFKKLKNLKFSATADLWNLFGSIHSCAHFSSKWVNFYILVVLEWENEDFLHFLKLFKKSKKMKFLPTADLGNFFGSIRSCAHFPSKRVNSYILVVLEWEYEDFLHFRQLLKKSKKLRFSPTADLANFFGSIHSCAHFPSKCVNLFIIVVLEREYEDFLDFRKTFQKIKKIGSFRPQRTWGTFLAQFTHVPIFHPNEWICIF